MQKSIYEIIGKCLEERNNYLFNLMKTEIDYQEPLLSDPGYCNDIVKLYCSLSKNNYESLIYSRWERSISEYRYIVVHILLKIYCPNCLNPLLNEVPSKELKFRIANSTGLRRENFYKVLKLVSFYYYTYPDFRNSADTFYNLIKEKIESYLNK